MCTPFRSRGPWLLMLQDWSCVSGVKVDERAAWGWYTPLHLAAKAGHEKVHR